MPNVTVENLTKRFGSNLVLALQVRMPDARLTVIDDFRCGISKRSICVIPKVQDSSTGDI